MSEQAAGYAVTSLRRGTMRLGRRLRMERPEHAMAGAELSVLGLLYRRGPMSAGELAWAERVQPQSLTRMLATLEGRGEIRRQPDPDDRRRSLVSITQTGTELLLADVAQRDSWLALAMADQLSPAETQLLMMAGELMERLAEADVAALRRKRSALSCPNDSSRAAYWPGSTPACSPCARPRW
jgi:DNA-binding MarR family transcriptional regulator